MTRLADSTIRALQADGRLPAAAAAPARSKYRNTRCAAHTPAHDSLRECRRYQDLRLLEQGGAIRDLRQQVPFVLEEAVILDGRRKPSLRYVADFTYEERHDGASMGQADEWLPPAVKAYWTDHADWLHAFVEAIKAGQEGSR